MNSFFFPEGAPAAEDHEHAMKKVHNIRYAMQQTVNMLRTSMQSKLTAFEHAMNTYDSRLSTAESRLSNFTPAALASRPPARLKKQPVTMPPFDVRDLEVVEKRSSAPVRSSSQPSVF